MATISTCRVWVLAAVAGILPGVMAQDEAVMPDESLMPYESAQDESVPEGIAIAEIPQDLKQELDASSEAHFREELGVNEYTTPSIEKIFQKLGVLGPIPVESIQRRLGGGNYTNRMQLAMNCGRFIAEGFLTVQTEDRDEIEDVGRKLLKTAQALGVGSSVTSHSRGLIESGQKGDWNSLRRQLNNAQSDVEKAMLELRDEQLAHMIALGGWLRGLEIATETLQTKHTEAQYGVLREIDLIDYFNDRLNTLHPDLKQTPLILKITTNLITIQGILQADEGKIYESDVKEIHARVKEINDAIMKPVDDWPEHDY